MLDIPHQLGETTLSMPMNATIARHTSAKVPGTERHRQHHHQHGDHRCAHGAGRCRKPQALTPGSAISEGGRPRPSAYICLRQQRQRGQCSLPSVRARSPAICAGVRGAPRCHRFEMKELGEVTMVSMAHLADACRELLG
jgi:hypothetical protein